MVIASVQGLFVGAVLLWAGGIKVFGRIDAHRSALRRLVGERRAAPAFRLIGAVEVVIALLVLTMPVGAAIAIAWCAGLIGYLGYARVAAPNSSCGCLGSRGAPVRFRSFARAGVLLVGAVLAALQPHPWRALADHPVGALALVISELALIVSLSPELDAYWLIPLRRRRITRHHPLAGLAAGIPVESSVQQLVHSAAYRSIGAFLRSDLLDSWEEQDWRLLTYAAARDGRRATAVFAVPLMRYQPDDVRLALVEDLT